MTTPTSLYGQSLYDLAAEEGLSEEILKEMEAVNAIFKENPDYITLLLEPSIPRRERMGMVEEAFKDQIHPYLLNFLMILLENSLLRGFNSCCRTYRSSYYKDNGIEEAVVTIAVNEIVVMVETINVGRVSRMPQACGRVERGGILQAPNSGVVFSVVCSNMRQIMVAFFDDMQGVVLRRNTSGKSKEQQAANCQLAYYILHIYAFSLHFQMMYIQ